jgi:hypothetical protein
MVEKIFKPLPEQVREVGLALGRKALGRWASSGEEAVNLSKTYF